MSPITKPMLASNYDEKCTKFPVLATPKIDGIRALKIDEHVVSRSFKPIPNDEIREYLEAQLPDGADGEITCGEGLYDTTSVVMSYTKVPKYFNFYWFDWVATSTDIPYVDRVSMLENYVTLHPDILSNNIIVPLIPDVLRDREHLNDYESCALLQGYEGVILRKPDGRYKCGRSTTLEGLLIKLKRYQDSEAIIVGTEELMHNNNEATLNIFGNIVRRSRQEHLQSGNTLGSIVANTKDGVTFNIGTGYTDDIRRELWASREDLVGKLVKYRHAAYGFKEAPRCPVFLGIRHADDIP